MFWEESLWIPLNSDFFLGVSMFIPITKFVPYMVLLASDACVFWAYKNLPFLLKGDRRVGIVTVTFLTEGN